MSLYAQQTAALDKHRDDGQQKITVERVNVAPGGQAIVGDVHWGEASSRSRTSAPPELDAPQADSMPLPSVVPARKVPR